MPEVTIQGSAGRLEGRYHHARPGSPVALLLHPHPQHGGSVNNRVVFETASALQARGFSVLRLNFRGVGKSQGRLDGGPGEGEDAAAALDWLETVNDGHGGMWVVGYSFGALVGMQLLMRRPSVARWVSIAPPVVHYDFGFLAPCPCGGLLIHGEADTLVPEPGVRKLVDKLNTQKNVTVDYRIIPGADHSFTGQATNVASMVVQYVGLTEEVPMRAAA